MKRMITVLLIAALCGANAWAQKGMHGLGVNIPLSTGQGTTALGIGAKYYYNISNYFRLEPSAEFLPIHSGGNKDIYDYPLFKAFLNGHIFLASPRPSRPYIIAGLGYVNYKQAIRRNYTIYYNYEYDDGFNCNIGLGYDFRISHSFSIQLEAMGMNCLANSDPPQFGRGHKGNWTFLGQVGLTYNF